MDPGDGDGGLGCVPFSDTLTPSLKNDTGLTARDKAGFPVAWG